MATSPNYAWAEPDNSSLVKNGAADIRTLGDAIDTSVWNVGFGQAGKNKIINGDFSVNQRNFTSVTTDSTFGFDRWQVGLSGGTATYSTQTFTLGTAPVAGYEAKNFARLAVTTGNDYCRLQQRIESVRTFAGQTATISFWAKGTNPATLGSLNLTVIQNFGTGGSPSSSVITNGGSFTLTANWTRYSLTVAIPSISGKTIGTSGGDNLDIGIGQGANASTDSWTLDLWGVQVEYGSKATPFQTASGGSPQQELAMCQRYYRLVNYGVMGACVSTTTAQLTIYHPSMRTSPTLAAPSAIQISDMVSSNYTQSSASVSTIASTTDGTWLSLPNFTGLTSGRPATLNSSTGITLSAEL